VKDWIGGLLCIPLRAFVPPFAVIARAQRGICQMSIAELPSQQRYPGQGGIVLAALSLSAGMIAGAGIIGIISYFSGGEFLFVAIGAAIAAVAASFYSIVVLLLMTLGPANGSRVWRKSWIIALIGLSYQLVPVAVASLITVYSSEVPDKEPDFRAWFLAAILLAVVVPLLCLKRTRPSRLGIHITHHARWVIGISAVLLVYGAVWNLGSHLQTRRLDRDCNEVIAWVKLGHPDPGCHLNLKLPPALAHLATDGTVDAAVLEDGRTVLLFRTDVGWIGAWEGFVYCTGPLRPSEVGLSPPDPEFVNKWGYPPLRIEGLGDAATCVFKRLNPHEYVVGYHN
jgi:MFS family permease